jgi:hypothetical protein
MNYDDALVTACDKIPTNKEAQLAREKAQREEGVLRTRLTIIEKLGYLPTRKLTAIVPCTGVPLVLYKKYTIIMNWKERLKIKEIENLSIILVYRKGELMKWGNVVKDGRADGSIYYVEKVDVSDKISDTSAQ